MPYDPVERKVIAVHEYAGMIVKVLMGVEFDSRTGEVTKALRFTSDFQLVAFEDTLDEKEIADLGLKVKAKDLFPQAFAKTYADVMVRRFLGRNRDLWMALDMMGIGKNTTFDVVRETRVLIDESGRYRRHATGRPVYKFLIPNDSRGREVAVQYPNGDVSISLWWFEGRKVEVKTNGKAEKYTLRPGIEPGTVVFKKNGSLKETKVYQAPVEGGKVFDVPFVAADCQPY